MGENGSPGNFIQRYLTSQSLSPEHGMFSHHRSSESHIINSMPDDHHNNFSSQSSRTPESQRILDRISSFCGKENLIQRVSFLDQELSVFGYPSVVSDLSDNSSPNQPQGGAIDLVTLVNISYDLLQSWRQSFESQSDANDLQRSSDAEIVRLRHLASRLKEDIATKDRDMKSKELMQLQLSQRLENLKKKLKAEQEKTKRLTSEMTARDSQFRHEKKKKIQEIEKLQSRLQQLLQDKRQERMLGIEILNSLQRADGKRGKWSTDKTKKNNEQDMYRLIITNYEDSQKQLLKENEGMRRYLKEMQDELISALNERNISGVHDQSHTSMQGKDNQTNGDQQPSSRSSSAASNSSDNSDISEPMSDGMFEMPFDLVKEDIEKSIRTKWRALKKEIRKTRKASRTDAPNRESVTDNEYDDLVQQQQDLIDYLTTGQGENNDRPIPEDCYFLEEKAELEKEKNSFKQQKQTFDKERQLYAEALVQLDDQRQAFEVEKNKWLQQNFLQMTPFRADQKMSSSSHQNLRGKDPSSHHSKSRQQPYQPRSSLSPDRPALKVNDHQSNVSQGQQNMKNSPNNISHSLSRLHSSSHHNSSFSPDSNRSTDISWQNHTPENNLKSLQRTKSTPNTMLPPSTAELYRSLGLVYYGSDKENDVTVNAGKASSQICPQSSGTVNHQSVSHSTVRKNQSSKTGQGSYRIQSKIYPNGDTQLSPTSSEYISAATSLESGESDPKSIDVEFFDAQKKFAEKPQKKGQKTVPREREIYTPSRSPYSNRSPTKNGKENFTLRNEFQMSRGLARPDPQFLSSVPGKRKSFLSKSCDEKTLQYQLQQERNSLEKTRPKKSGIKNFMRNFIMGNSKHKPRDDNNNDIADSDLFSNSDSALSLHYALNDGIKQECWDFPYPSANSESLSPSHTSDVICHQRTRSFPSDEILSPALPKRRSYSYDSPILTAAAERHKSALLSISISHEAINNIGNVLSSENLNHTTRPALNNKDLNLGFGKLSLANSHQQAGNNTGITTNESQGSIKFGNQYHPIINGNWLQMHSDLKSLAPNNFEIAKSQSDSSLKTTSHSGSTYVLSGQSDSSFNPGSHSGSTYVLTGQSDSSFNPGSHSGSTFILTDKSDSSFKPGSQSGSTFIISDKSDSSFKPESQSGSTFILSDKSVTSFKPDSQSGSTYIITDKSDSSFKPDSQSGSTYIYTDQSDSGYLIPSQSDSSFKLMTSQSGSSLKFTSQSDSSFKPTSLSGSSYEFPSQSSSSLKLASQSSSSYKPDEFDENQFEQSQTSLHGKPIECSSSLLEQLTTVEQNYQTESESEVSSVDFH